MLNNGSSRQPAAASSACHGFPPGRAPPDHARSGEGALSRAGLQHHAPPMSSAPRSAPLSAGVLSLPVIIAALGYFVDIYDIVLIGMVGKASLLGIGVAGEAIAATMGHLLGLQMVGMLLGGFAWGMIADRWGRMTTLFGSILLYSTATLLNGFVTDLWHYEVLRVIAGFGLAGELGVGITLVVESLPREKRAYGATVVACVGIAGAVLAWAVNRSCDWRHAFVIGGVMGYVLLILRWLSHESGLFRKLDAQTPKGSLRLLFGSPQRIGRYLLVIAMGLPTWFVVGIFVFLAPKTAAALKVDGEVVGANAILLCYIGLIVGDIAAGFITQALASRRKTVLLFMTASLLASGGLLLTTGLTATTYYAMCFGLGLTVGFWALFVTIAAEQFGTNLRATVATTVPNVARGLFYPMQWTLFALAGSFGYVSVVAGLGVLCFGLALFAVWKMPETHGRDLDYLEELP